MQEVLHYSALQSGVAWLATSVMSVALAGLSHQGAPGRCGIRPDEHKPADGFALVRRTELAAGTDTATVREPLPALAPAN
jgi:hypothetical protein